MSNRNAQLAVLSCVGILGCGVPEPTQVVTPRPGVLHIDMGAFTVQPGESETCFSTGFITDRDYAIGGATAIQAQGGHHVAVLWTMDATEFAPRPCTDEDMLTWNYVAAAGAEAGGGGEDQSPPDGLAFRLPRGAHIVVQAHYINITGAPMQVHDAIDIEVRPTESIMAYAAMFAVNDGTFEIPPHTRFRRVSDCTLESPRSLVLMLGHMHEAGFHFSAEVLRAGGTSREMLYDHPWESNYVSHPPVIRWPVDAPLALRVGDTLRQTCEWENTTSEPILFPSEMCSVASYYYPDVGEGFIACQGIPVESTTL